MKPFKSQRGMVAPLDRSNVDTDQIIAKQFLKSIARTGFGPQLFYDWRYQADGKPNPDFSLNQPRYKNASILVAGNNFGCGSSREHAVWAIQQYGFEAVVAPSFADIFKNNCSKNAVVTIELSEAKVREIFKLIDENTGLEATVDLEKQTLILHAPKEIQFHFDVDPSIKDRLLHGLDDIGTTLKYEDALRAFEGRHDAQILS